MLWPCVVRRSFECVSHILFNVWSSKWWFCHARDSRWIRAASTNGRNTFFNVFTWLHSTRRNFTYYVCECLLLLVSLILGFGFVLFDFTNQSQIKNQRTTTPQEPHWILDPLSVFAHASASMNLYFIFRLTLKYQIIVIDLLFRIKLYYICCQLSFDSVAFCDVQLINDRAAIDVVATFCSFDNYATLP